MFCCSFPGFSLSSFSCSKNLIRTVVYNDQQSTQYTLQRNVNDINIYQIVEVAGEGMYCHKSVYKVVWLLCMQKKMLRKNLEYSLLGIYNEGLVNNYKNCQPTTSNHSWFSK